MSTGNPTFPAPDQEQEAIKAFREKVAQTYKKEKSFYDYSAEYVKDEKNREDGNFGDYSQKKSIAYLKKTLAHLEESNNSQEKDDAVLRVARSLKEELLASIKRIEEFVPEPMDFVMIKEAYFLLTPNQLHFS